MPTTEYPKNPNTDTVFVVQEDGTKNRAVMTAPQDISTIEYPNNPNSTKAYITVDGKKHRVVMVADLTGGGGGGSVDYTKVVSKTKTMPVASADNTNMIYMYDGTTNATYTHGYIYENKKTSTYTGTVTFEPATHGGTVSCSGDDFANFLTESGVEPLSVVSGTMTYDFTNDLWMLVGKDANNETVLSFQEYRQDFIDAGFVFSGFFPDGDVVAFTCSIEEASTSYAWNRIDVQPAADPLPSQTGQSGKFLSTDGTDASWSDKPLVNKGTVSSNLNIFGDNGSAAGNKKEATSVGYYAAAKGSYSTAIGSSASTQNNQSYNTAIGSSAYAGGVGATAVGYNASANANCAIQLGTSGSSSQVSNTDANTFKVANANGNFEMMSADGTIPTARLTKVNTTITLASADWSSNSQTVNVTGMTATGVVFPCPIPADQADYTAAGIICSAQAAGTLTFTCDTVPSGDIDVTVVMM